MTEQDMQDELVRRFGEAADLDESLTDDVGDDAVTVRSVSTFDEHGLLTRNMGVVLVLDNGDEFQLTIVKSAVGR